jgi:multiple sugar transport system substrate-binding protein
MTKPRDTAILGRSINRRDTLRGAAGLVGGAALLGSGAAGAAAMPGGRGQTSYRAQDDGIIFLSSQLTPIEEAEKMRNTILANFEGSVEFIGEDPGPFADRIAAEAQSGQGSVGVVGGLHGDMAGFVDGDYLEDLTDLAEELADRGISQEYLDLAKFGGDSVYYIPWMQASYIMTAHRDALEYLPDGLDEETLRTELTYDHLLEWAANLNENVGPMFGLPAGEDGLLHRFFQGYAYPSFTGGLNTTFNSDSAVEMWEWFGQAWEHVNPQALTYNMMDVPLQSGEVWVAWDHTARLINALREMPDDFVTFPAPRGPEGLGQMPAIAGLAIPKTAPDKEGARALIDYLTLEETQLTTLREVAFFPSIDVELPDDLDPGIQAEADAVQATISDPNVLTSLLPVGLGDQNGAYNKVFRDTFMAIAVDGNDIREVLDQEAQNLQGVLDTAGASCWTPDPESDGVCQVGSAGEGGEEEATPAS